MVTTSQQPDAHSPGSKKPFVLLAHRELVAANFQIAPKVLADKVPRGLELDYYKDETYVSLVCMLKQKVNLWGLTLPVTFVEISLRFYVRHPSDPTNRKGTCFIKNFVSSGTCAWILGNKFDQKYSKLKIKHANSGFVVEGEVPEANYEWKIGDQWNQLRVRGRNRISNTGPDTKVGFILDHRTHYQAKGMKTLEYHVERPKWTVWDAAHASFSCDTQQLFGREFVKPLQRRPASVFLADGSDVSIFNPTIL